MLDRPLLGARAALSLWKALSLWPLWKSGIAILALLSLFVPLFLLHLDDLARGRLEYGGNR